MPIFFNKKKREEEKARREVIARVHEKPVNRVSERNPADYTETILGEGGVISILAEDIAVLYRTNGKRKHNHFVPEPLSS